MSPKKRLKTAENDTVLADNDKNANNFVLENLDIAHSSIKFI